MQGSSDGQEGLFDLQGCDEWPGQAGWKGQEQACGGPSVLPSCGCSSSLCQIQSQVSHVPISAPASLPTWLRLTPPGPGWDWHFPRRFSQAGCFSFWQYKCCLEHSLPVRMMPPSKVLWAYCSCYSLWLKYNLSAPCDIFQLEFSPRKKVCGHRCIWMLSIIRGQN